MIDGTSSTDARANFCMVPGRSISYTYDSNGNVTKETYSEGSTVIFAINYEYDTNGRLTDQYTTNN